MEGGGKAGAFLGVEALRFLARVSSSESEGCAHAAFFPSLANSHTHSLLLNFPLNVVDISQISVCF